MTLEPRVDKLEQYVLTMSISVNTLSAEMREFKNEMREFKDEMNIKWGNLANQMGKIVEDIILPNIDILISKYYDEELQDQYAGVYKRKSSTNKSKQFDGIITTENHVFLFEIKNQVNQEQVDKLRNFAETDEFFEYFTEYEGKKLIPVMGSINLKEHQVKMLTDAKILAIAIKGDILTFKNFEEINR